MRSFSRVSKYRVPNEIMFGPVFGNMPLQAKLTGFTNSTGIRLPSFPDLETQFWALVSLRTQGHLSTQDSCLLILNQFWTFPGPRFEGMILIPRQKAHVNFKLLESCCQNESGPMHQAQDHRARRFSCPREFGPYPLAYPGGFFSLATCSGHLQEMPRCQKRPTAGTRGPSDLNHETLLGSLWH